MKGFRELLAALAQREELPLDEPAPERGGPSFLSTLLAPESLPREEAAPQPRTRRSFLAMLFAREHLSRESETRAPGGLDGPPAE